MRTLYAIRSKRPGSRGDYLTPESHSDNPGTFWHPDIDRAWLFSSKPKAQRIAKSVQGGARVVEVKPCQQHTPIYYIYTERHEDTNEVIGYTVRSRQDSIYENGCETLDEARVTCAQLNGEV